MKCMEPAQTWTNSKSIARLTLTPTLQEITLVRHKKNKKSFRLRPWLGFTCRSRLETISEVLPCDLDRCSEAHKRHHWEWKQRSGRAASRWIRAKMDRKVKMSVTGWEDWCEAADGRGDHWWDVSLHRVELNSLNVHWICFYYTLMSHTGHEGSDRCLQRELKAGAAWPKRSCLHATFGPHSS